MTVSPSPRDVYRDEIRRLARICLIDADDNQVAASALLMKEIKLRPILYESVTDPLLRNACYDIVGAMIRRERAHTRAAVSTVEIGQKMLRGLDSLSLVNRAMMESFRLPGGKRLGDATKDDLAEAIDFYTKQINTMTHDVGFMMKLYERLKPGQMVRQAFKEKHLWKIYKAAKPKQMKGVV